MTDEPEIVGAWRELIEARDQLVRRISDTAEAPRSPIREREEERLRGVLESVDGALEKATRNKTEKRGPSLRAIRKLTLKLRLTPVEEARAYVEDFLEFRTALDELDRVTAAEWVDEKLRAVAGREDVSIETLLQEELRSRAETRKKKAPPSGKRDRTAQRIMRRVLGGS